MSLGLINFNPDKSGLKGYYKEEFYNLGVLVPLWQDT